MDRFVKLALIFVLTLCAISCSCNKRKPIVRLPDRLKYDTVRVVYPKRDAPWEYYGMGVSPYQYMSFYSKDLRILQTTDTTFIRNLINAIDGINIIEHSDGIDTWVMVLLHHTYDKAIDTLAINSGFNWFNGAVYKDPFVFQLISDEIIKYDKVWAELISDYYVDGEWRTCTEVALSKR